MNDIIRTIAAYTLGIILVQEIGGGVGYHQGYYVSMSLRRYPSQVWLHYSPPDICLSAGRDWKESGKWKRDCVGAQLTNDWVSCFRKTW